MIEAIVASALTVYVLLAIVSVVLFLTAYNDSMGFAFVTTIVGLLAFQFLSNVDPWGYIKDNPKDLAFWAAAYFPIGIAWSFFRWWHVLKDKGAELLKYRSHYSDPNRWTEYVKSHMPTASNNKSSITCWITYWPFSVASYLLVDILCDIGNWIYSLISGLYQRLADHVTATIVGK